MSVIRKCFVHKYFQLKKWMEVQISAILSELFCSADDPSLLTLLLLSFCFGSQVGKRIIQKRNKGFVKYIWSTEILQF